MHPFAGQTRRVVVRIIEDLDLQPVARVVEGRDGVGHALNDVALVVDGHLNQH